MTDTNNLIQSVHVALINSQNQVLCMRGFRKNGDPSTRWMTPGGRIMDGSEPQLLQPFYTKAAKAKLSQKLGIPSKDIAQQISALIEIGRFQWDKPKRDERLYIALLKDGTPITPLSSKIHQLEWLSAEQIQKKHFVSKKFQTAILQALELYPTMQIPATFKPKEPTPTPQHSDKTPKAATQKKPSKTNKKTPAVATVKKPKVQIFPVLFTKEDGATKVLLLRGFYTPQGKRRRSSKRWKLPKITKPQSELFLAKNDMDEGIKGLLGLSENGYILKTFVADKSPYHDREIVLAGRLQATPQITPDNKQVSRFGLLTKEQVLEANFTYKRFRKYILSAFDRFEKESPNW